MLSYWCRTTGVSFHKDQFRENPAVNYPTVFPAINLVYSEKANDYGVGDNIYRGYRLFAGGITKLPGRNRQHSPMPDGIFCYVRLFYPF